MDQDLRELAQKVAESPDDKILEYKFRLTAVREGKGELAKPFKVNDEVLVTEDARETSSPWINGPWVGIITKINEINETNKEISMQIKPKGDFALFDFRVRPNDSYLNEGIYLTQEDVESIQLITPALVA